MPFTQADLAALDVAIASGTKSLRFQDRMQEFRSLEEMLSLRAIIMESLTPKPIRQVRLFTSKGI